MEKRINIVELLHDCPSGMELDCTTWENVTFEKVVNDEIYIKRNNKTPSFDKIVVLNKYGCCTSHQDEKCRIFPKGMNTWERFVPPCKFKDGDIVVNASNEDSNAFIYAGEGDNYYHSYVGLTPGTYPELFTNKSLVAVSKESGIRFATEEEKQKLFDSIKSNGYRWNAETKTLEKLIVPKFKVGDRIKEKQSGVTGEVIDVQQKKYNVKVDDNKGLYVYFHEQYNWELLPDKFDITTLVPFESRVLVRSSMEGLWKPAVFGFRNGYNDNAFYIVGGSCWKQCIPYLNNEHLCGTTNDCNKFYKVWE